VTPAGSSPPRAPRDHDELRRTAGTTGAAGPAGADL